MPSLTDVAFIMPILFIYLKQNGAKALLGDAGTGWHVRTGEWILANGRVPRTDIFSFTKPGAPWFAWEWLWDVLFGLLHLHWGLTAVVLGSVLLLSITFALLYREVLRACGNPLIAFATTQLAMVVSSIHWLARPHLVTLLLTVVFLMILTRAEEGKGQLLRLLPPLMVFWANLHGGFIAGLMLVATYGCAHLAAWSVSPDAATRRGELYKAKLYILALAGCCAASLLNPYLYRLHLHIFHYLREPFHFTYIQEFQSPSFQAPAGPFFELLVALSLAAAVWNLFRGKIAQALLVVTWVHLGLLSIRNLPILGLVAAPVVTPMLSDWLDTLVHSRVAEWLRRTLTIVAQVAAEVRVIEALPRWHAVSGAAYLFLAIASFAPGASSVMKPAFDPQKFPIKAAAFLDAKAGRIFTGDQWGSYLIYRLYPHRQVFVDDRSDFYGGAFDQEMLEMLNARYDWSEYLDRYAINTVLLPPNVPLATTLKESPRWRATYDDGRALIFRRAGGGANDSCCGLRSGKNVCDREITNRVVVNNHKFHLNSGEEDEVRQDVLERRKRPGSH
jgi:hypothetical protein